MEDAPQGHSLHGAGLDPPRNEGLQEQARTQPSDGAFDMIKLSLLGTASALALTLALTQGASATPLAYLDDNQANLWSDGNANDSSTINKTFTANTDNSVTASTDDDQTANNSFNYSNREDKRLSVNLRKDVRVSKTELEAEASDGSVAAVNGDASDSSVGRENSGYIAGDDLNTGTQTDISLGDVMVNLASANAGLQGASMSAALKAGVHSGSISCVDLASMHGIAQVNNNTGIASQANNVALNAIVK